MEYPKDKAIKIYTEDTIREIIENRRRIECECNLTDSCASCYLYDDLLNDFQLNDKKQR